MGRGSFNGGSTVIGPGSSWFSKPKPQKPLTEAERLAKERQKAENKAKAKKSQKLALQRRKHKEERKAAAAKEAAEKKARKAKDRLELADRRKTDPKYLARRAEHERKQNERMNDVVVEVKRKKRIIRDAGGR